MTEKIFAEDEMTLMKVDKRWSPEELLAKNGIFFLKDVAKLLGLDSLKVIKKVRELEEQDESPWQIMGLRKIWSHWTVRMKVFAPYYEQHLKSKVRAIEEDWDGNVLLKQKGIFLLSEVCELIPFSTYQIRYQAKQNPNSQREYGIWKDKDINRFVVDMEVFAPWLKSLWAGHFRN